MAGKADGRTLRGRVVRGGREAVLTVEVRDEDDGLGDLVEVEAIVDTGFTGHLTLPAGVVSDLGLRREGDIEVELANGEIDEMAVYEARVRWHGQDVAVAVYETDGGPLLGMSLLDGSRLIMDAVPGGDVLIEDIS